MCKYFTSEQILLFGYAEKLCIVQDARYFYLADIAMMIYIRENIIIYTRYDWDTSVFSRGSFLSRSFIYQLLPEFLLDQNKATSITPQEYILYVHSKQKIFV